MINNVFIDICYVKITYTLFSVLWIHHLHLFLIKTSPIHLSNMVAWWLALLSHNNKVLSLG